MYSRRRIEHDEGGSAFLVLLVAPSTLSCRRHGQQPQVPVCGGVVAVAVCRNPSRRSVQKGDRAAPIGLIGPLFFLCRTHAKRKAGGDVGGGGRYPQNNGSEAVQVENKNISTQKVLLALPFQTPTTPSAPPYLWK